MSPATRALARRRSAPLAAAMRSIWSSSAEHPSASAGRGHLSTSCPTSSRTDTSCRLTGSITRASKPSRAARKRFSASTSAPISPSGGFPLQPQACQRLNERDHHRAISDRRLGVHHPYGLSPAAPRQARPHARATPAQLGPPNRLATRRLFVTIHVHLGEWALASGPLPRTNVASLYHRQLSRLPQRKSRVNEVVKAVDQHPLLIIVPWRPAIGRSSRMNSGRGYGQAPAPGDMADPDTPAGSTVMPQSPRTPA